MMRAASRQTPLEYCVNLALSLGLDLLWLVLSPFLLAYLLVVSRGFTRPKYRRGLLARVIGFPRRSEDRPAFWIHAVSVGEAALSIFESGAILLYLAEKHGKFIPADLRGRADVLQWLMWQMGGLGPMAGQNHHFNGYSPEEIPYAQNRYVNETGRLYGVLNNALADRDYICGDYSIADMASYPWTVSHERQRQNLDDFPNLKRWFETIKARPGTIAAYAKRDEVDTTVTLSDEERHRLLFQQSAETVARK